MRWEAWSAQGRFQNAFYADPARKWMIEEARRRLSDPKAFVHLRIEGQTGTGKTRLALEICREEGLRDRVLYAMVPEDVPKGLFPWLEAHEASSLILVVDECDPEHAEDLAQQAERCEGRVRLLTIGTAREPNAILHRPSHVFHLKPLEDSKMRELLKEGFPSMPAEWIDWIAWLSSGYVKLAMAIASAVNRQAGMISVQDLVRTDDVRQLLEKFIVRDINLKTLQAIALFTRLGWEEEAASEGRAAVRFIGLSWEELCKASNASTTRA